MAKYIPLDAVLAEIEKLKDEALEYEDKSRWFLAAALKKRIDTLEVKEVNLEHLEQEVKDFCYEYDDRKEKWYNMTPHDKNITVNPTWANFAMSIAKHFFELGMQVSNKAQKKE